MSRRRRRAERGESGGQGDVERAAERASAEGGREGAESGRAGAESGPAESGRGGGERGRGRAGGEGRRGRAKGGPAGAEPAAAPGRAPYRIRPLWQVVILVALFAVVTLVAELAGAANLGVALGIGQIVFGVALVVVLVRS